MGALPFFPDQASTSAVRVDALYLFLVALSAFFSLLIASLVVGFAVRYRRVSEDDRPAAVYGSHALELIWTLIPLLIVMVIFVWSTRLYFHLNRPPRDAQQINVVGKRWMWKVQHMTGQREINELHVPVGVPIKLVLGSEDVIHSFFVPAFRIKQDAVPGRLTTEWFQATKPGRYHLFCAEYCGTKHSGMIGWVTVMEPADFQAWLGGGASGVSLASAGEKLFQDLACVTCHKERDEGRGPSLIGLYGRDVHLTSGEVVKADESYIRESIVNPAAKVVAGYQPIMPAFQGLVTEEGLMQLVAYIQTLKSSEGALGTSQAAPPTQKPPRPKDTK
jgi:cytochrome c oxidase subunit 2